MSNNQSKVHRDQPLPRDKVEVEAVAEETGASEEQVAQLARATGTDSDLDDAAAAAARWS
jgi:hypothetical protein